MLFFLLKRISYGFMVLIGVVTVIFFLFYILPGDPARMMLDQRENEDQLQLIKSKYGFDLPIFQQYIYYLNDISPISFHSKNINSFSNLESNNINFVAIFSTQKSRLVLKKPYLRQSFTKTGKNVSDIIAEVFFNTAILAITSIIIAFLLGTFLGIISGLNKGSFIDSAIGFFSVLGMSVPSFFSAILVAWIFGFVLSDITGFAMTGSLYFIDDFGESQHLSLKNLVLPSFTLGIRPLAVIIQLMRNSLIEVMQMDYIRTARAKGLIFRNIILKHALKNSFNPVVTAVSGWFASMLAGAVFVEYIFGWNGIGKLVIDALNQMDLPVLMGCVIVIAVIFVIINIIVDLIYGYLNPKIRYS